MTSLGARGLAVQSQAHTAWDSLEILKCEKLEAFKLDVAHTTNLSPCYFNTTAVTNNSFVTVNPFVFTAGTLPTWLARRSPRQRGLHVLGFKVR